MFGRLQKFISHVNIRNGSYISHFEHNSLLLRHPKPFKILLESRFGYCNNATKNEQTHWHVDISEDFNGRPQILTTCTNANKNNSDQHFLFFVDEDKNLDLFGRPKILTPRTHTNKNYSGKFERLNDRGLLVETCNFVNGILIGEQKIWNDDGSLIEVNNFIGHNTGTITIWNHGVMVQQYNVQDGMKHGLFKQWYNNGTLATEHTFVKNEYDGRCRSWFPNGVMILDCMRVDKLLNGMYEKWHSSGARHMKFFLVNEKIDGLYEEWNFDGKLIFSCEFSHGKIVGYYKKWNDTENDYIVYTPHKYVIDRAFNVRIHSGVRKFNSV